MVAPNSSARPLRRSRHSEIAGRFERAPYLADCHELADEIAIASGVRSEVLPEPLALSPFVATLMEGVIDAASEITDLPPQTLFDPWFDPTEPADPTPEEQARLERSIRQCCAQFLRANPRIPVCDTLARATDAAILRLLQIEGMTNTAAARLSGVGRAKVRRVAARRPTAQAVS